MCLIIGHVVKNLDTKKESYSSIPFFMWGRLRWTNQLILIATIIKVRIVITSKLDQIRQEVAPIIVVIKKTRTVDLLNLNCGLL